MTEEPIAKVLGGPGFSGGVTEASMHVNVIGDREKEVQECLSWTPVKSVSGTNNVPASKMFSCDSSLKRSA